MHWVAWSKVAKPLEAGGLNLKQLTDAAFFWKSKLAWSWLNQKSLWAKFMNKKYSLDSVSITDSLLWKQLRPIAAGLKDNSFWRIGEGKVKIWSQKWWPMEVSMDQQVHFSLPDISIAEVWADSVRKEGYLALLPEEVQQYASRIHIDCSADQLIWKGNESGIFSSRDFRMSHYNFSEVNSWWRNFWQPWIPTKISCFVWKCLNHAVPVDEDIQKVGIPFVSKCVCCKEGNIETLSHLLLFSEAAKGVWDFLNRLFEVQVHYYSIRQVAAVWCQRTPLSSQFGCLKVLAFTVALWEIWKWRNNCIHARPEDPATIRHKIIYLLQHQSHFIVPRREASWIEELAINSLFIPRKRVKASHGNWVKWSPKEEGITVNLYGAAQSGSAVFRDNQGVVVWSIRRQYPSGSDSFQALFLIMQEVIKTQGNFPISEIQVSDKAFFDCMTGRRIMPWRWWFQLKELKEVCVRLELKLIDKEANRLAVTVGKIVSTTGVEAEDLFEIPEVRKVVSEDRLGLRRWRPV